MIAFTIFGEAASKANSRQVVRFGDGTTRVVKSAKALDFEAAALLQVPAAARRRLEGPVRVTLRIFYATERPDLDESIVLDVLQDRWTKTETDKKTGAVLAPRILVQAGVYRNDRQVREKHVFHGIDRANPRTEVVIEALQPQQESFLEDDGVRQVARPLKSRPNTEKAIA